LGPQGVALDGAGLGGGWIQVSGGDGLARLVLHDRICGYGRIGRQVAVEFKRKGVPFVVVEQNPEVAQEARECGFPVVEGDATRDEVLEAAGVKMAKGLVAAADSDADNVFVVLSARSLNPGLFIVARSETEDSGGRPKACRAGVPRHGDAGGGGMEPGGDKVGPGLEACGEEPEGGGGERKDRGFRAGGEDGKW